MDRKSALVAVSFLVLIALLVLEIDHALTQNRSVKHDGGPRPVFMFVDLSLREPEHVGVSFSTGRSTGPVQHAQEPSDENTKAGN